MLFVAAGCVFGKAAGKRVGRHRRFVRRVARHFVVKLVPENELVRQLHPMWLHGMGRAIVELPYLWIVQISDPRLRRGAHHREALPGPSLDRLARRHTY